MKETILLSLLCLLATVSFSQYGRTGYNPSFAIQQTFNHLNHTLNGRNVSIDIWKGKLQVTFNDGSQLAIKGTLKRDSSGYYIKYRDQELKRSDSASRKKITPDQTLCLKSKDPMIADSLVGKSNDSCWIFNIMKGKINLFTTVPTKDVHDDLVTHIQQDNGPVQNMSKQILGEMLKDNEKAYQLFLKNKITKAVKKYNKSGN